MIYGAKVENEDEELTIDNFTQLVDPQSWEEFMPKGVTKQRFNAFKKYYDPDIFTAAAKCRQCLFLRKLRLLLAVHYLGELICKARLCDVHSLVLIFAKLSYLVKR